MSCRPLAGAISWLIAAALAVGLAACSKPASQSAADEREAGAAAAGKPGEEKPAGTAGPVVRKPEQVQTAGIAVTAVSGTQHRAEVEGYGLVLPHDTIAQAAADLHSAEAVARQSASALARARSLAGSPGAVSADQQEAAGVAAEESGQRADDWSQGKEEQPAARRHRRAETPPIGRDVLPGIGPCDLPDRDSPLANGADRLAHDGEWVGQPEEVAPADLGQ